MPGGAVRARHTLTNLGAGPYVVDQLEVVFPLPSRVGEVLDFTGRQTAERIPQRHRLGDGLWLREGRRGHTGHDAATMVIAGVPGFGFGAGEAYGVHVAWSGNTVHAGRAGPVRPGHGRDRSRAPGTDATGGHHHRRRRAAPARRDRAGARASPTPRRGCTWPPPGTAWTTWPPQFHGYLRRSARASARAHARSTSTCGRRSTSTTTSTGSRPSPTRPPASASERFVLDDGWFQGRRDDRAGWATGRVDEDVWPGGLHRLVDHVRGLRHAVRAVDRARDGQPGLRAVPGAPRLDPVGRAPPCRRCNATSSCST